MQKHDILITDKHNNNKPLICRKCDFRADTDSEYEMMNHMMLTHGIENESTTISDLRYMHRNNNLERTIEKPITHTGEKTQIHTEKTNENMNKLTIQIEKPYPPQPTIKVNNKRVTQE